MKTFFNINQFDLETDENNSFDFIYEENFYHFDDIVNYHIFGCEDESSLTSFDEHFNKTIINNKYTIYKKKREFALTKNDESKDSFLFTLEKEKNGNNLIIKIETCLNIPMNTNDNLFQYKNFLHQQVLESVAHKINRKNFNLTELEKKVKSFFFDEKKINKKLNDKIILNNNQTTKLYSLNEEDINRVLKFKISPFFQDEIYYLSNKINNISERVFFYEKESEFYVKNVKKDRYLLDDIKGDLLFTDKSLFVGGSIIFVDYKKNLNSKKISSLTQMEFYKTQIKNLIVEIMMTTRIFYLVLAETLYFINDKTELDFFNKKYGYPFLNSEIYTKKETLLDEYFEENKKLSLKYREILELLLQANKQLEENRENKEILIEANKKLLSQANKRFENFENKEIKEILLQAYKKLEKSEENQENIKELLSQANEKLENFKNSEINEILIQEPIQVNNQLENFEERNILESKIKEIKLQIKEKELKIIQLEEENKINETVVIRSDIRNLQENINSLIKAKSEFVCDNINLKLKSVTERWREDLDDFLIKLMKSVRNPDYKGLKQLL